MSTNLSERSNDNESGLQGGWRESDGNRMKGCKTNSRVSAVMEAVQFSEVELHQERIENGVKQEDKNTLEAKKSEKNQRSVPFYKLFCFADWLDYVLMAVGTIGACAHGAAIPVFFIFFGRLIDAFGSNYNNPSFMAKEVSKYALCFVYLGLVVLGAAWLEVACWMQSGERQSARMRMKYLKAMLSQDVGYFDTDTTTGEIVNSISSDTILVQDAISEKAGNYIHYMARFFAGFAVGFSSVWQLTLVTLAVVPAIALAGGLYAVVMVGLTSRSQKAYTKAGEIAEEAISQIRTVYSFVGEAKAREQYSKALEMTMELGKRGGLAKGLGVGTTYGLLFGAWALLLWYAGTLVRHGITNGGQAFTTILNVVISGIALGQAAPNLTAFGKAKAAGYNILEMINRTPAIDRNNVEGRILENLQGQIVFQHVSFSYPSRPDVLIFQDFCLTILAGKTVAIVGSSGSGKSTVVSLIERFYDPVSGAVLLDGENIKNLQLRWLRGQIGLVNQEPALFATSLLENILYGKENAGMEEVEAAATAANAHHFIERLPDGYHTQVGERGVQLSGGQKQRIAIARAMLKNPTILLLDEATSALDASSEHTVQEALDRLMIGRTTVVVAHRLSTVRNVDMIAVLNQGKVVEIGTHNQLISKETGAYATLVRLQETAPSRQLDGAAHSRRMSRGSLSQRNFSFHSGMASENDSGSLCMDTERSQQLMSMHKPSTIRLLKLNFPEWHVAVLGSLGAIMAGVETPLFALAISQVLVIFYFPDKEYIKNEVRKYALIFSGATVVTILIYLLQHYFFGIMGERLTKRVREKMFAAILENEVGWFDYEENNSSLVSSRLASDATLVRAAVGDRMSTIIQNIALTVTSFIISFSLEWHVTLVILACFPLMIGAAIGEQLFLKGFGGNLGKAYSRASMVAGEAVGNIRTVAAFSAEEKVLDLFCRELDLPKKRTLVLGQLSGFGYGISQFFMFSSYGLALWYSSTLVRDNKTSFGNVIKAFMVLIMTAFGIAETLALAPDIVKGSRALSFIFEILDRKTAINPDDPRAQEVVSIKGEIELRHVEFAYPARPDVMVFHDLSLKVHAGRSLALVGTSGSGKSSVISLIARFYDPLRGKVMVDGKDIKRLKLRSLRRHIGLVQQEPALFATTIYNNILYGKDGATEAEIVEAAKAANAHNFISALPSGYQTEVGERGVQLSGGQKQRVAIARAVLKDPAILLLDEATSALDAESEKVVQGALDHLMRGRTTVVVAHRLSTVRNADTIAVLQEGLIIEQGRHLELMNKVNGAYVQLVSMQQQQQVR